MTIVLMISERRIKTVQRPEFNTAPTTASTQLAEIMKFMVSTFYCLIEDYDYVTTKVNNDIHVYVSIALNG